MLFVGKASWFGSIPFHVSLLIFFPLYQMGEISPSMRFSLTSKGGAFDYSKFHSALKEERWDSCRLTVNQNDIGSSSCILVYQWVQDPAKHAEPSKEYGGRRVSGAKWRLRLGELLSQKSKMPDEPFQEIKALGCPDPGLILS